MPDLALRKQAGVAAPRHAPPHASKSPNTRALCQMIAMALFVTSYPAFAEDASPVRTLTPIIVTAPMQDTPLTVVTDPKAPRQPVPASDGADFLKSIPGFSTIRKGGSNGDPMLRGMVGSRLNILIDGGQIGGGCPGRMDPPTAYISPELYDRVTVVKGPETVLYGPGNSAGVVLFDRDFSRYSEPGYSVDASALGGAWGRNDLNADVRAGSPDGYLGVSANHTHSQDYKDGDGNRVHSSYDRWNADVTAGWTPSDDTRVELTAGTGNGQAAYASSAMDGVRFLRESVGLKVVQQHLTRHWDKLEVQLYSNYTDHVMDNYTLRQPNPSSMMPMAMATDVDRHTSGGRIVGSWRWDEVLQLDAGVDGSTNVHDSRSGGPPGSMLGDYHDMPRIRDARMQDIGAFSEMRWTFAPKQRLIAGARVDRADLRGYGLVVASPASSMGSSSMNGMSGMSGMSPAIASVTANRSSTLPAAFVRYERDLADMPATFYAGLGHVERFPDYWELFGQHVDSSLLDFKGLAPEKTTQLDVGLQYHDSRIKAWVSGYVGVVNDFILIRYPSTPMGSGSAANVQAHIAGGEAGLTYAFTKHWKGDATLAYAWGRNQTEGRPLPQMPPLDLRLGLTYQSEQWSIGGLWRLDTAQHRIAIGEGNIVGQDIGSSGGFGVFSINAGHRLGNNLTLTAGIDNLFNKTYAEHINAVPPGLAGYVVTTRVNEPGRTLWMKIGFNL